MKSRLPLCILLTALAVVTPKTAMAGERSEASVVLSGTDIEMIRIPGGEAPMGSDDGRDDERPVRQVRIETFWIGRHEVTQRQWQKVTGSNPSRFSECPVCPVDSVSWEEGKAFLEKASTLTGVDLRYPTEAEWEFAAGGGAARQKWPGTDRSEEVSEFAWYSGSFAGRTRIAGTRLPNLFGLYDMGGNVAEWCSDWYAADYYGTAPAHNPAGPGDGTRKVVRGGSWLSGPSDTRVSRRSGRNPDARSPAIGFRIAADRAERTEKK